MIKIQIHINGKNTMIQYSDEDIKNKSEFVIKSKVFERLHQIFDMKTEQIQNPNIEV